MSPERRQRGPAVTAPDGRPESDRPARPRTGGIYVEPVEPTGMSTPTKITLGTIGIAAVLALAYVVALLA